MRITALEIRNFKAFGSTSQKIGIKPITLIFGANSSGKSSLLHSLLWLHHAVTRGETDVHEPVASAGCVNLGGFDSCINQKSRRSGNDFLVVNIHTSGPELRYEAKEWLGNASEFTVKMGIRRQDSNSVPVLAEYKIEIDGEPLFSGHCRNHKAVIGPARIDWSHPLVRMPERISKRAMIALRKIVNSERLYCSNIETILPTGVIMDFFGGLSLPGYLQKMIPEKAVKKSYLTRKECSSFINHRIPSAISTVLEQIKNTITGIRYLPPLRSIPFRYENLGTCGDATWRKLADDRGLVDSVNKTLERINVNHQVDVRRMIPETGAKKSSDYLMQLRIRDTRTDSIVNLQDVGVGIGQVLPIIIESRACKEQLVIVEQPEIHIHPALQAKLGDVFIESALGGNQNTFLLETHSEHLILRILRRIRETTRGTLPDGHHPIRPEDVAVLYVEPGAEGAVVRELRVNEQGRFIDEWPNGFFEERFNEEF